MRPHLSLAMKTPNFRHKKTRADALRFFLIKTKNCQPILGRHSELTTIILEGLKLHS